jgi:hypothetical protein
LTSAAGDQSENRGGGGISSWQKKGLSLFGVCLFLLSLFSVRNSRQNKKKRKKGRAKKKKMEGTNGPDPLLESNCLVPAFFDDEYVVNPCVVELRSKMKSSIKGHMFEPHLVKVHCVAKSSNKGHMLGPHLVEVHSETKSSNKGHILDHIWLKSTA